MEIFGVGWLYGNRVVVVGECRLVPTFAQKCIAAIEKDSWVLLRIVLERLVEVFERLGHVSGVEVRQPTIVVVDSTLFELDCLVKVFGC